MKSNLVICFFFIVFAHTSQIKAQVLKDSLSQKELELKQAIQFYESGKSFYKTDLLEAIKYTKKAKLIFEKYPNDSLSIYKKCLNNLGFFYTNLGERYTAKGFYETLNALPEKDSTKKRSRLRRLGHIYADLGDIERSINYYEQAITYSNSNNSLLTTYLSLARLPFTINSPNLKGIIHENLIKSESLRDSIPKTERNYGLVDIYFGNFYVNNKDYKKAAEYYLKALLLFEKSEFPTINYDLTDILNCLGICYKNIGDYDLAAEYYNKALIIVNSKEAKAGIFDNLGDLHLAQNQYKKALNHYQKAIIAHVSNIDSLSYLQLPSFKQIELNNYKIDILGYLIDKANGWVTYYEKESEPDYLQKALETFILADQVIDLIYTESREELSQLFWRQKSASFYPQAVDICYQLNNPEKAFYFMEKNKAMLLLSNITDSKAKYLSKLPDSVLYREINLLKTISNAQIQFNSIKKNNQLPYKLKVVDSIKKTVFDVKETYIKFVDSLELNYPQYYNYKKKVKISNLQEVQNQLQGDELVFQYIISEHQGFVLQISKSKVQLHKLQDIKNLIQQLNRFKILLSKPLKIQEQKLEYKQIAAALFKKLFPFENIQSLLTGKKVNIIADHVLQYIPFEALLTSETEPIEDAFLLNYCQVSYNNSMSLKHQTTKLNNTYKNNFRSYTVSEFKNSELPPLSFNENENSILKDLFGNKTIFHNKQASKKQFMDTYGDHKIIHVSTHGGVDSDSPWLAFYDDKVRMDELYFMKNKSDLIVLSACKTSEGKLRAGEGVMSLTRGFFHAGAKSIVSSLWNINDKSSSEITQNFYSYLKSGTSRAKALQQAKLDYIKKNKGTAQAYPHYWSALILTGETSAMYSPFENYIYYTLGSLLILILFFRFYRKTLSFKRKVN